MPSGSYNQRSVCIESVLKICMSVLVELDSFGKAFGPTLSA